jgi:luciferase family oxidoreductase group 1
MATSSSAPALSVLDVCPVRAGEHPSQALAETVELARTVEALGFRRYWLAEHHNTAGIASSAPEVLITHVADATSTIRVGSGGIMLPNHSPLKVAETFRTLGALFPDRIDLGIGRAPGTDLTTALALRRSREAITTDQFPQLLGELLAFFEEDFPDNHPFRSVQAAPAGVDTPPLFLLGSSDYGANVAAQLGLGFAFARHINPGPAVQMLRAYRDGFRPGDFGTEPYAILGVSALCADTAEEAERLAAPLDLAWLRIGQGRRGPAPSFEEALAYEYTPAEEAMRRANRARHVIGDAASVADQLHTLAAGAQADEVMVLTMAPDAATRRHSYELLAAALAS